MQTCASFVLVVWEQAAERGHAGAMTDLGLMYAQGQGVLQDYDQVRGDPDEHGQLHMPDQHCQYQAWA